MGLPEVISIQPLARLPQAEVVVPGSKSLTNRALIVAVLREGTTTLKSALWSEDTRLMVSCLRSLGFEIVVETDPDEASNRTLIVRGQAGRIPRSGTVEKPLELFVGNAGTAARFLMAVVCLGNGRYRLSGSKRMHERPQSGLIHSLRQLGYHLAAENDRLPIIIDGAGPKRASCEVDLSESSQFASALLLAEEASGWQIQWKEESWKQSPYVKMTSGLIAAMKRGGEFSIEPDASSGSYFWGINALGLPASKNGAKVSVRNWPHSGWQIDADFPKFLTHSGELSRERDLGDSIMTAIVLAALGAVPRRFVDLARLRVQECERVAALRTELTRCGVRVVEEGESLTVFPGALRPAVVETYGDHRMAMCFALLALRHPEIRLRHPACVEKTFPNFFQKLSAEPPFGLGTAIRNGHSGQKLEGKELMAK